MAKVRWCKGQILAHRDQERLQWGCRNLLTASLSLITTSFFFPFFFLVPTFLSLQTPELSILKTDCFIEYVSFELCIVIGAFLKAENFPSKGITEVYQAGNFGD